MIISNLHTVGGKNIHIRIAGENIASVYADAKNFPVDEEIIDCENALVFPGLINSHDHLEFNLFPQLGNGIYKNYTDWANDIQLRYKETIDRILQIPARLRIETGIYKNLLSGVTTVVNHGKKIDVTDSPVTVFQNAHSLHSVAFEKNWKWKLNTASSGMPVVMHIGEGTDERAHEEIDQVLRWNFFKKKIVAIHGVSMGEKQAPGFRALVWCPASNLFFLGATAAVGVLKKHIPILFGTDSPLSAAGNVWKQLREARSLRLLNDQDVFSTVTENANAVWKLDAGKISENSYADIVVAKKTFGSWDDFFSINPENILLVIHHGQVRLFDELFRDRLKTNEKDFTALPVGNSVKYVWGDLNPLLAEIKKHNVEDPFLLV
jgi:cytosine/adenosine deaminase-related metal-dependent hydrolase